MIKPFDSQFLTPTKNLRRLSVLLAIHNDSRISQHKIGKITHLSSSMVNNYIKEFQREGRINMDGKTNRTQSYHLTGPGRNELISLLLSYSAEIIQLYSTAKREIVQKLDQLKGEGIRKIALFGAAETAEVVHTALRGTLLTVTAVVDSDPSKQGKPFDGLIIQPPEHLKDTDAEAVVITSFAKQQEIHKCIRQYAGKEMKVIKLSDF